jgi:YVTN family beta-propeller protein
MRIPAYSRLFAVVAFAAASAAHAQIHISPNDGPGLGNLTFQPSELFRTSGRITAPPTSPRQGPGNVDMVNGYLMVLTETDGGGSATTGAFEFWNVSNPRMPFRVIRHDNVDTHGNRENHGFSMSSSYAGDYLAIQGVEGIMFWDVTDPLNVRPLNYLDLPGISQGDYSGDWWLFWQAPYVYVAGQGSGLYIVDAKDPSNPVLVRQMTTGEIGGHNVGVVQALGNLLIVTGTQDSGGRMTTLDISDPINPKVLNTYNFGATRGGYTSMLAGGHVYTAGGNGGLVQLRQYSISHDGVITIGEDAGPPLGSGAFENGGYMSIQSGYVFAGFSNKIAKFRIASPMMAVGEATAGTAGDDEDFAVALGNIIFMGDDHGIASYLVPHQAEPDTIGPEVEWIHPANGAGNQAVTSRVGVSMSEIFDLDSVHSASFIVRRAGGGAALPGKYSKQHHLLNFSPDEPLLPFTTYEVIVQGIRDHLGNAGGVFTASFTTGAAPTPVNIVKNAKCASGTAALTGAFGLQAPLWSDRPSGLEQQAFVATGHPTTFDGKRYVRTCQGERQLQGPGAVTFDLTNDAHVYVLFDTDRVPLPPWLSDGTWTATGEIVNTTDLRRHAYRKRFARGPVSLGGNGAPALTGSMYNVLTIALPNDVPTCQITAPGPVLVGVQARFTATSTGGSVHYSWNFGDASGDTPESISPDASHAYAYTGRYAVVLHVRNSTGRSSCTVNQIVHYPITSRPATHSSTIAYGNGAAYVVNADNDTVTSIDAATLRVLWEAPVGAHPRTLAVAANGDIWVVNQDDATISVLNPTTGHVLTTHVLRMGSQPYGIAFGPDGRAYVTLQATGELVRMSAHGATEAVLAVGHKPRGVAVSGDGERILVSQFVSTGQAGRVREISGATFAIVRTFELAFDAGPDSSVSGRGVPNYLTSVTISPDGRFAVMPSKKDNIARGVFRDGRMLNFETMVRAIVSEIDLSTNRENLPARLDLNDRSMPQAAIFSPRGDLMLVSTQGTNSVEFIDASSGAAMGSVDTGLAPQGMVLNGDATRLFVHNFMARSVSVFDSADLMEARTNAATFLAEIGTVAVERLAPQVLLGKRIFYNAGDPRMSRDKYISCSSCHLDGDSDQQVWDFTQAGEGFRNTISLIGKAGMAHGRVHWTANFDEIQDFENDIRHFAGGAGFLSDADFQATQHPLGAAKAGRSIELDALAAFVSSLDKVPVSPYRNVPEAPDVDKGRKAFVSQGCASCHAGPNFTDGRRWDVGTIRPHSGNGQGAPLAGLGFRTPSLRNAWATAPYLHDGSAATLNDVLDNPAHVGSLNANQKRWLLQYLLQIDGLEPVPN